MAEERHRKSRYSAYIADVEKTLITKRDRNVRVLNDYLSPSPEVLCSFLDNENNRLRLWERSFEEEDFLSIRMGLGNRPFSVQLKIPKQGFQLHEDELRNLPVKLAEKYSVLNNVPLTLDKKSPADLKRLNEQIHYLGQYLSTKATYKEFLHADNKKIYHSEHQDEIAKYEEAAQFLKRNSPDGTIPTICPL